jgi:hypothetical protein
MLQVEVLLKTLKAHTTNTTCSPATYVILRSEKCSDPIDWKTRVLQVVSIYSGRRLRGRPMTSVILHGNGNL